MRKFGNLKLYAMVTNPNAGRRTGFNSFTLVFIASLFLLSCVSGYHAINPATLHFQPSGNDSGILIEYRANVLTGTYAKHEMTSKVTLLAVKITNNTAHDIIPHASIKIFSGEKEIKLISMAGLYGATKLNPDIYLLFLLLAPVNVYSVSETSNGGQVTSRKKHFYPVGLIIGPSLALGNRAAAKKANKKFKKDLEQNDILDKIIPPGETSYGLIALEGKYSAGLTFKTIH